MNLRKIGQSFNPLRVGLSDAILISITEKMRNQGATWQEIDQALDRAELDHLEILEVRTTDQQQRLERLRQVLRR